MLYILNFIFELNIFEINNLTIFDKFINRSREIKDNKDLKN